MKKVSEFVGKFMAVIVLVVAVVALFIPKTCLWIETDWINYLLMVIMFGMGLTMKLSDFAVVFKKPKDVIIGCIAQFVVMPALAYLLGKIFGLSNELLVGVVLVGTCPGGTSSNVITYLSKGDTAMSVGMTSINTLLAPLLTPALTYLYLRTSVNVDVKTMFLSIIQVVIIPVAQHKEGVLEKAEEIRSQLSSSYRVKLDDSDQSPGWKYSEYEMKGVPVRLEIGPRDIEAGQCVLVTRHNREKTVVSLDNLESAIAEKLAEVKAGIWEKAVENRKNRTYKCTTMDEIKQVLAEKGDGFVEAMWCGDEACEDKVKEETGVGSRCIPFAQEQISDKCVCCGKPAKCMVMWANAY